MWFIIKTFTYIYLNIINLYKFKICDQFLLFVKIVGYVLTIPNIYKVNAQNQYKSVTVDMRITYFQTSVSSLN